MADLTLILFLVVAASYREDPPEPRREQRQEEAVDMALGQPMAVFRPGGDADLTRWLGAQALSGSEVATVIVRHREGEAARAVAEAAQLVARIERSGEEARLLVEPSEFPETLVVIAHDRRTWDGTEIADTR